MFYKHIGQWTRRVAAEICAGDGDSVHLPIPRFPDENEFYKNHFSGFNNSFWLGITNDKEGLVSDNDVWFTRNILRTFTNVDFLGVAIYDLDLGSDRPVNSAKLDNYDWILETWKYGREGRLKYSDFFNKGIIMSDNGEWKLADEYDLIDSMSLI